MSHFFFPFLYRLFTFWSASTPHQHIKGTGPRCQSTHTVKVLTHACKRAACFDASAHKQVDTHTRIASFAELGGGQLYSHGVPINNLSSALFKKPHACSSRPAKQSKLSSEAAIGWGDLIEFLQISLVC